MANLAIRGHATRGKEVIELLEMLGGRDTIALCGNAISALYSIFNDGYIDYFSESRYNKNETEIFTLEEFLEKFPYKVGDKVMTDDGDKANIVGMVWDEDIDDVFYEIQICNDGVYKYPKELLQPYKEEIMEEIKIDIPKGYEFTGVDDDNQQVVLTKIQPQYPVTYEECCMVLDKRTFLGFNGLSLGESELYRPFIKLMRCRDAYWKIAGDWKYDVNKTEEYFYIVNKCGRIVKEHYMNFNHILAFPTEEMRDAFFENFKDLIEQCKEML